MLMVLRKLALDYLDRKYDVPRKSLDGRKLF